MLFYIMGCGKCGERRYYFTPTILTQKSLTMPGTVEGVGKRADFRHEGARSVSNWYST